MAENIKIPLYLMLRNSKVATIDITFCDHIMMIDHVDVINLKLFPHALQCADCRIDDWLMSRLNPSNTRHYINLMPIVFHNGAYRRPHAQFALSLETNGLSLSDHYWFNPETEKTFCYEGRTVCFKHKTWDMIDQWHDNIWSNDLNTFLFHDMLFANYDAPFPDINNPIFATSGNKEKMWYNENGKWVLEKRLPEEQLRKEVKCLSFFMQHDILIPEYKINHHDITNRYQFRPTTIRNGFDTIQKRCLASKTHQLTPLNWYISEGCDDNIHGAMTQVKKVVNIDSQILNDFEKTITEYLATYNYQQIASSNLGFLVDCDNNAVPVVWSCVGYTANNPFAASISNS